jgi:hypothetical protein
MSNILDQNGVSFIPVNRKLTVGEIVNYFCDFLQKRKTPIDIYENTKILDFTLCYAPSYLVLGEFDFSWIAKLTFNNETSIKTEMTPGSGTALLNEAEIQERFGFFRSMYNDGTDVYVTNANTTSSQMDKGVSSGGVSIIVPCNCNELSAIDDKFYPTVNEINSLLDTNNLLIESELGEDAIYDCMNNSVDFENSGAYSTLDSECSKYAENEISQRYKEFNYSLSNLDIQPKECTVYSVLIPIWRIDYSYNNNLYSCFVVAHSHGKSSLFGKSDKCCGTAPIDSTDAKGLFKKIKNSKDKKSYKKQQSEQYRNYWTELIKNKFF